MIERHTDRVARSFARSFDSYGREATQPVNYGHCPKGAKNAMPVAKGWDVMMRIYKPDLTQTESYQLPEPKVVSQ